MYRPYGLPSNILLLRNIVALYLIVVIFVFSGLIKSTHGYNSNGLSHHNSPPVFDFKRDWIIKETEPLGHKVATVSAHDADGDEIKYGLEAGLFRDGLQYFNINPQTGQVFIKQSLTGQAGNSFYILVTADDGYHSAKIEVNARIVKQNSDINDYGLNKPSHPFSPFHGSFPGSIFGQNGHNNGSPSINIPIHPFSTPKGIPSTTKKPTTSSSTVPANKPTQKAKNTIKPSFKVNVTRPLVASNASFTHSFVNSSSIKQTVASNNSVYVKSTTQSPNITTQSSITLTPSTTLNPPTTPETVTTTLKPIVSNSHHGSNLHRHSHSSFQLIFEILPLLATIFFFTFIGFLIYGLSRFCTSRSESTSHLGSWPMMIKPSANKCDSIETSVCSITSDLEYRPGPFYPPNIFPSAPDSYNLFGPNDLNPKQLIPNNLDQWEFPRHHLRLLGILGEGCFGRVWKCEAFNINNVEGATIVAVKTTKETSSEQEKRDLMSELEIMSQLESHPNVVSLLGCCTEIEPRFLILEYVPFGTLQSYLRDNRSERFYGNILGAFTSQDLTSFGYQISKGMEYISSKGIIHRDLAARNILMGNNKTCKIGDFGFSRKVTINQIYERKSEGRLPIRWMAPESLSDNVFTTQSDVWSFGILMWEIVTLGSTPYPGMSTKEVMRKVREGYRLEKPEHCKREIYNIMFYCWNKLPEDRPDFPEITKMLDNLVTSENDYIELDRFPDHSYYNVIANLSGEKL
ncbi:uncharacterized protein LOC107365937 [Tetranychus urticae]|uniref:receptor protein-tyrosine kinase n=1 Tax=Tetranychus urticae TaxID=32264 RepID=T1KN97_TETUR|nr:uncharacterized protein LOC107365937 [Tetranychus urticae]